MTCVLSPAWQPSSFTSSYGWSPMNSSEDPTSAISYETSQQGYVSSESESRQPSTSSGKKRASRAGTRSVTTLSAAQLERKRANDREAQRAIRQRTKDHIDHLEKNISDLRTAKEASENLVSLAQQRTHELEEENAYLRTKLDEFGYTVGIAPSGNQLPPDQKVAIHPTSPITHNSSSSIPSRELSSTPRSVLSLNTSQSSTSRHGSWQQGQSGIGSAPTAGPPGLTGPATGPPLSTWRSHDSFQSAHSVPGQFPDTSQSAPQTPYSATNPNERPQWSGVPQSYPYHQEQPQRQHYEPSPQTQPSYAQAPVAGFVLPPAQQVNYQVPPPPPPPAPADFHGLPVSSPQGYPQGYVQQPVPYQMAPMQMPPVANQPDYTTQQPQMQPPPVPAPPYHPTQGEQHYAPQQMQHPPLPFREDPATRGYSLTHFPSG